MAPPCAVRTYPLNDGDVIDIGKLSLEVVAVPGHTYGSVVFLNRSERTVFSGDACNANTLLLSGGSATVSEYAESLRRFRKYRECFDVMYGGHCRTGVPADIIDDALMLCGRIMEGSDDAQPFRMADGREGFFAAARGKTACRNAAAWRILSMTGSGFFKGERVWHLRSMKCFSREESVYIKQ